MYPRLFGFQASSAFLHYSDDLSLPLRIIVVGAIVESVTVVATVSELQDNFGDVAFVRLNFDQQIITFENSFGIVRWTFDVGSLNAGAMVEQDYDVLLGRLLLCAVGTVV
jgi:hypothetical protein